METTALSEALAHLRRSFTGDIRDDRLYRSLYATDASIYQIAPDAVLLPRTIADVQAAVETAARFRVPITPRGAGTGLTGGALNHGLNLDCSRHLNRVVSVNPARRMALVEPGAVLDVLNAQCKQHGLHFAPDVAPSSRATIGGMIANNSCGAHSVYYGRTVDHVLALRMVLADGSLVWWGEPDTIQWARSVSADMAMEATGSELAHRCEQSLEAVMRDERDEIDRRFPKILRSSGGYGLDRLRSSEGRINVESIICGSEGTLGIVVGAVLNLVPLPRYRGLVVAQFADLLDALAATPAILQHGPAAVELLDRLLIDAARSSPGMSEKLAVIEGSPHGVLVIELFDDAAESLNDRLNAVSRDLQSRHMGYAWSVVTDDAAQTDVWSVRKAGLGLLMSRPGDRHPYDFVDDTAVDPSRLRDYIARFMHVLREEGVEDSSYYAHASVGCLHVKPVLNLRKLEDVHRMHRVADRISDLALEFNGAMTGEHGDGLVRSEWIEKMFGPRIVAAFRRIKDTFDPQGILNPGKIVNAPSMTKNLRWQTHVSPIKSPAAPLPILDFSIHGGMLGLAEMCSGVGQCRQTLVGTMCPSYMATGDELHTTRARANALRHALTDQSLLRGLDDPALYEVMDLCISCKACKTECPTGVDMARLKTEWLHRRNMKRGMTWRDQLIGRSAHLISMVGEFAPLANWLSGTRLARWAAEAFFGIDRRIKLPRLARQTFRSWFDARPARHPGGDAKTVCLFIDTWTNHFRPEVGFAAVRVLEYFGWKVVVPESVCCGRPAISKGMLHEAKSLAEKNIAILMPFVDASIPIVCLEPSCASALMDELPQLVSSNSARRVASSVFMIESFLARHLRDNSGHRLLAHSIPGVPAILYHGHCHQKALVGSADGLSVLRAAYQADEINSGCCGMAGSFGHESEHYEVARAMAEQRLLPAIRSRGDAQIAVSGFSCRCQIEHHAGVRPRHVIEWIADLLPEAAHA